MHRYIAKVIPVALLAFFISACETFNNNIWFPKFDLIGQDGNLRLYSYRSLADRVYPADSESAEQTRIEQLELQLQLNKLPRKDYKILSRELQYIRSAWPDGYPVHWVNYVVQVPASP